MVWIDVTTLLNWNRPPVGIVRTDAEFVRYTLEKWPENGPDRGYLFWNWREREILEVPEEVVRNWLEGEEAPEKYRVPMWVATGQFQRTELDPLSRREEAQRYRHPFKPGDQFISIGLDWEYIDYSLLYFWKEELGLKVGGAIYDLIPILHQDLFPNRVFGECFLRHIGNLLHTADKIFTISHAVEEEVKGFIKEQGFPMPEIQTIYLGDSVWEGEGEERKRPHNPDNFLLYVSTIDNRKNHLTLVKAYNLLVTEGYTPPDLVFVGMGADGLPAIEEYLHLYPYLRQYIHIYTDVENPELITLYRRAKFTLFPSKVEGWGLGSRESLLFKKPVLISKTPALIEATQGLMPALPAESPLHWAEGIKLMEQPEVLEGFKKVIETQFKPRSWEEFGRDLLTFYLS
jgi:glycosyltransferase involved in cell wall biosynthesis